MSEKEKNFHNFALQSSLFKGHSDWYYCFLKAERIAHVVKKRKDGFSMFALLFGVGVALLNKGIGAELFRVMSWIVSFVSSEVIFSRRN